MLGGAALNAVLLIAAVTPVAATVVLAWLFRRAGKRYDERERAAGRGD